jgi:DNA (cytosine-5)-methyltransferase 1
VNELALFTGGGGGVLGGRLLGWETLCYVEREAYAAAVVAARAFVELYQGLLNDGMD